MKWTTDWQQQDSTHAILTPAGPGLARLFGLPFAAVGGYMLYQFLSGVVAGDLAIGGWLLLPVFTAAFLVPGWLILTFRKRIHLDSISREATEEFDFLVYRRRSATRIPPGAFVVLRFERMTTRAAQGPLLSTAGTTFAIHVYLAADERRMVLVGLFQEKDKPQALALANKTAAFFGIAVQDRCREGGEVTAGGVVVDRLEPDEVD